MHAHTLTFVSIVRLEADVMTAVIERVRNSCGQRTELQEVILDIRLQADMMCVAVPVETGLGADLMLGHCAGFGEEVISRSDIILHLLLRCGAKSEESLNRPERSLVKRRERMRFRIGYFILLPHTPYLRIVVEMAVLMVEDITAVESEIEFASAERMPEIKSDLRLAQCRESPLGLMMRIDVEDGSLAVIQVIAEIKERIRVTNRAADVAVVVLAGLEAGRLREQRMERRGRHDVSREGGILDRRGLDSRLHYRGFGSHFAGRLYHGLEIALDGNAAIQRAVGLRKSGCS